MKGRTLGLVVMSGVLAVGAAMMANNWALRRGGAAGADQQNVVIAAIEIPYGQKIEAQHVKVLAIDKKTAPPGTFDTIESVVGKVSKIAQLPGDILRQERVADTNQGSTLAVLISKNKRAITVRVDDVIGVAGFLLPGNRVDVLATKQNEGGQRDVESKTLLRDLKVLAVDQTAATDKSSPVVVRAVTLEMEPKQAEILVKARDEGKISLALRNPFDESLPEEPKPVEKKVAVRAAPPAVFTTVIRGTDVSQVRQ